MIKFIIGVIWARVDLTLLKNNFVLNDETIEILMKQALLQSQMGCDVIAPSDMMDGRVG